MSSLTVLFGVAGLLALAAAIVPKLAADRPFSVPLVMLLAGIVFGLLPLPAPYGDGWSDPAAHLHGVESFTQLGILVALGLPHQRAAQPEAERARGATHG